MLGEEGKGFYHLMFGFNAARVLVAAACLGGAEKVPESAPTTACSACMFGKPLVKYERIHWRWPTTGCSSTC